jgi:hypothetical protein
MEGLMIIESLIFTPKALKQRKSLNLSIESILSTIWYGQGYRDQDHYIFVYHGIRLTMDDKAQTVLEVSRYDLEDWEKQDISNAWSGYYQAMTL